MNRTKRIILPLFPILLFLGAFPSSTLAQTIPLLNSNKAVDTTKWYISDSWNDASWNDCFWKPYQIQADGTNLKFTIASKKDFKGLTNNIPNGEYACGEIQSLTKQNYGTYTVTMKTASGSGLNTAFFTYNASPHDEIDFEFLGLHPTQVSINYWVNGVNQSLAPVNLGFDASQAFHTYVLIYTPTSLTWYADHKLLFQTKPGAKIPTSLSRIYLEFWAGYPSWLGAFNYTVPVSAEYASVSYVPNPEVTK